MKPSLIKISSRVIQKKTGSVQITTDIYDLIVQAMEEYAANGINWVIWHPSQINPKTGLTLLEELVNFVKIFKKYGGNPNMLGSITYPLFYDLCVRIINSGHGFFFSREFLEEHCLDWKRIKRNQNFVVQVQDLLPVDDCTSKIVNIPDYLGNTHLMNIIHRINYFLENPQEMDPELIDEKIDNIKLLMQSGTNIKLKNEANKTALDLITELFTEKKLNKYPPEIREKIEGIKNLIK